MIRLPRSSAFRPPLGTGRGRFELTPWFASGGFIASGAAVFDRNHGCDDEILLSTAESLSADPSKAGRIMWIEAKLP